ncbi:MAG: hypothetical protein F6K00_29450 [Leptolyngbya sp. SIOISBB]|nr:hypothetical protein [Leptolyngbya sp. SIOISBB]
MQEPLISQNELERLVEVKVRQVLSEMLGLNESSQAPEYLPIAKAVKALGYDSPSQIYKDMDSGLLRVGKRKEVEDRRRPGRQKARYYINIPLAKKRLAEDPSRRRLI